MFNGYYELYWNSICLREMFFQVCENGKRVKVMMVDLIEKIYSFLWGDLVHIPLPGGSTLGISLLIILLIPAGIYFTIRTRFLPISAVTHIQNTAPAPPAEIAATTPTRFPIPTLVAVDTTSA